MERDIDDREIETERGRERENQEAKREEEGKRESGMMTGGRVERQEGISMEYEKQAGREKLLSKLYQMNFFAKLFKPKNKCPFS